MNKTASEIASLSHLFISLRTDKQAPIALPLRLIDLTCKITWILHPTCAHFTSCMTIYHACKKKEKGRIPKASCWLLASANRKVGGNDDNKLLKQKKKVFRRCRSDLWVLKRWSSGWETVSAVLTSIWLFSFAPLWKLFETGCFGLPALCMRVFFLCGCDTCSLCPTLCSKLL